MTRNPTELDPLVGSILLAGVVLSCALLITALTWQWISTGSFGTFPTLTATNLLGFLLLTMQTILLEGIQPSALANLGIATLLLTPFISILASVVFFGFHERNHAFTAITGFVLLILGIILFAA